MIRVLKYTLILFLVSYCTNLYSQYDYPSEGENIETKQKKRKYADSKFFIGGNVGFWFGKGMYINLEPVIGYKITPRLWTGLGPIYQYTKEYYTYRSTEIPFERNMYGAKVFGQFTVFKDLSEKININLGDVFLYAENEILNLEPVPDPIYINQSNNTILREDRTWIDIALVGFGMRYNFGQRFGASLYVLWDLSQNPEYSESISNPIIRFGFNF